MKCNCKKLCALHPTCGSPYSVTSRRFLMKDNSKQGDAKQTCDTLRQCQYAQWNSQCREMLPWEQNLQAFPWLHAHMWNLQRHQTRLSLLVNLTATYRLLGRERWGGVASFEHQMQTETVSRLMFTSWSRTQPACIHFPTFLRKYSQWSILFD